MEDRRDFVLPEPHPVFEDLKRRRIRVLSAIAVISTVFLTIWAFEFAMRVYELEPLAIVTPQQAGQTEVPAFLPRSDLTDVVMRDGADTDCGQGLLSAFRRPSTVAGYVPYKDPTALSGLRARCGDLGAVLYEAFSFGSPDGRITELGIGAAAFPLEDFHTGWRSRNRPAAFPVVRPVEGLSGQDIGHLFDPDGPVRVFAKSLGGLGLDGVDGGLCLDMSQHGDLPAEYLLPALEAMQRRLQPAGLLTCLVAAADAGFWESAQVLEKVDRAVAQTFRTQNELAAPQDWSEAALQSVVDRVPADKLYVGYGTFGTGWQSGRRRPERLSYAHSMLRASLYSGNISLGPDLRTTSIRYLDEARTLNQIRLLDAVSFQNTRLPKGQDRPVVLWPLGYEDPAIWRLLNDGADAEAEIERPLEFSNHAIVDGAGPFSGLIEAAAPGRRLVELEASTGKVIAQSYSQAPRPHRIRFFGSEGAEGRLALTFNGLGNVRAMQDLLGILDEHAVEATFFVSTRDLIQSGELVPEILAAGHSVGTALVPRPSLSWLSSVLAQYRNNLTQHFLSHMHGHRARLVRNPARYGPLPGDVAVLTQLQDLQASGYLPVQSTAPAPYGKVDVDSYIERIRPEALARPVNVLSLDFGIRAERETLQSLPAILTTLRQDGLMFHSLPNLAGLEMADVTPAALSATPTRDKITYAIMQTGWLGAQNFILLLALIVALRSPIYLLLAFLRKSRYPLDTQFHPPVTVVIPAFNEEMVIESTIKSVLKADYPDLSIIVVDDGSTDLTAKIVTDRFGQDSQVTLLQQQNRGKWSALDRALAYTETPIIVIVDADSLLNPKALSLLVQPFRNERIGAVAGTVEVGNRDNLLTTFQIVEYLYTQQVLRRAYEFFDGVIVVPGAIGAWRVKAVHDAGQVSGDTITEDADLTIAVHRAGYRVAYQESAKSYTEVPNTVRAFMRQRLRWTFGMFQVSWKHAKSIIEGRPVGYISLVDAVWYGLITSLIYPIMDAIFITSIFYWTYAFAVDGLAAFNEFPVTGALAFLALTMLDIANLAAAFWFAKRFEWKLLLAVPLLRFGYRQLLYVSTIRAILRALAGHSAKWNKLNRSGTAIPKF